MSTAANPVETAAPPSEQQITDEYIEKRLEGKTDDLPIPPPTIPETIKPPVAAEPVPEAPEVAEIKATDGYIEERKVERERKRGGKQARIDLLTKEKKELEEKLAAATPAPAVEPPKEQPAKVEPAKVEPAKIEPPVEPKPRGIPKARPAMNDYTDVDEYQADMALWAVSESERLKPPVPQTEQQKQEPVRINQVQKEEFDRFLENGKRFIAGHSDFNIILEAAHVRGLTMSEAARTAITRLAAPEVAYWLARPENDLAARSLMNMDDLQQVVEIGRIAERLAVRPSDFVSNAPPPGARLNGSSVRQEPVLSEITDTDEYIRLRKQQRRGKR